MDIGKKNPLFWNSSRNKLTRAGITYILKKYAVMARMSNPNLIPEVTSCHQLRHSRAMHLLQSGVNLVWIRDLLGHSSIQTTEIYARADSKQKREAIEKASENLTPSDVIGEWVDNNDLISWLKGLGKK
jgi:site-specific recombinase XerD